MTSSLYFSSHSKNKAHQVSLFSHGSKLKLFHLVLPLVLTGYAAFLCCILCVFDIVFDDVIVLAFGSSIFHLQLVSFVYFHICF